MRHRHIMEMRSEMKYIESLREGERINEIYLCKVKQSALTKAGKPYDNLILQDKTGTLDAKIWEPGSVGIDEFDSLDYIAVMGDITSFQGNLQLNVKRVRKVQEGDDEYEHKTGSCGCKKRIQHKRTCFRRNVYCTDLCIYSICKC